MGYVPEDRHRDGLVLPASLWENVMLGHQRRRPFAKGPWVDRGGARGRTRQIIADFGVKAPSGEVAAYALSGGNQQKLIIGREMTTEPRLLLASHPTRGIDVGAQAAVWHELREARAAGLATLLISADLDELIGLSDRLLVLHRGRIVAELDPAEVTPADLGSYMTGARSDGEAA
jgi:simple sugar transport system ATP-binding protein